MRILFKILFLSIILFFVPIISSCKTDDQASKFNSNIVIQNREDTLEGIYSLETCEDSRFKITLIKDSSFYFFKILDSGKIISKGKAFIMKDEETYIKLGKIEGLFSENSIQIQNYGNTMNNFHHFIQCKEKYIIFTKTK